MTMTRWHVARERVARTDGLVAMHIWDARELARVWPDWPDLPRAERHARLREPSAAPVSPDRTVRGQNMILDAYLEALAAGENPVPTNLALGDGTTPPVATNTSLNNEVYRTFVGDTDAAGQDMLTSTFISQNEANGEAIREIGFTDGEVTDSWTQLTHLVLDPADQVDEKTSTMTITIDYALLWRRVS